MLSRGSPGIVCAVFRRSCYVAFGAGRLACLGDQSLGRGPLNVQLERFEPLRLGMRVRLEAQRARVWRPARIAGTPARSALDALRSAARGRVPAEGLGGHIVEQSSPLIEHCRAALDALDRWLAGGALEGEVERLLGLGPGLTPSGDDYLGGALVALRAFGRAESADALWSALRQRATKCTNRISAAHLAAAAEGDAYEALHACLSTLAAGEVAGWRGRLDRVASVGHCSGWDALAGAHAVADQVERSGRIQ